MVKTSASKMIPRIKSIQAAKDYQLIVTFDNGICVIYDVAEDIRNIKAFAPLMTEHRLFENFQLDQSRTCIYWNEQIDLPSDTILEYGKRI